VWQILALMFFQGLVNAFDAPARQALVVQMVDERRDLSNAIALNSSMVNGARLVGPALAGMLIAAAGEGYCFLLDGVSYLAVIGSLLAMALGPQAHGPHKRVFVELAEGWRYVRKALPIRSILILLAAISLMGMPYTVLMPIFAAQVLGGGPHTLGFLMAASGAGALASAAALAMRKPGAGLVSTIPASATLFGASLVAFGCSRVFWLSAALLFGAGFGCIQEIASSNTILQTIVAEDKRGRVMAYYSMAFQGIAPFGSLGAGAVAARVGAPGALVLGGVVCAAAALWFGGRLPAIRRAVGPIYRAEGGVAAAES
jgi:MFS family permease